MKAIQLPSSVTPTRLTGVVGEAVPGVLAAMAADTRAGILVVFANDLKKAESWAESVAFLREMAGDEWTPEVLLFPEPVSSAGDDATHASAAADRQLDRLATLTRLAEFAAQRPEGQKLVVLTTPHAFFAPAPRREELTAGEIRLRVGEQLDPAELKRQLAEALDYDAEAVCEYPGQFAARGGLVDVYPVNADAPVRIDFFGDEIEAIRPFDPTSQRTEDSQKAVTIASRVASRRALSERHIFEYFAGPTDWVFLEPAALEEAHKSVFQTMERLEDPLPTLADLLAERAPADDRWIALSALDEPSKFFAESGEPTDLGTEGLDFYRGRVADDQMGLERLESETAAREAFLRQLAKWQYGGQEIVLVMPSEAERARLEEMLAEVENLEGFAPRLVVGPLRAGFRVTWGEKHAWEIQQLTAAFQALAPSDKPRKSDGLPPHSQKASGLVIATDRELFGRFTLQPATSRRRKLPNRRQVDQALDFSDLADGDYLVHLGHGICRYRGLQMMELRGKKEEVITLEFADKITLHLPLYESHLLTRYVGLTKTAPKLGKIGGPAWAKARTAAEKATVDFAAKMLRLQAQRAEGTGHAFAQDTEWQRAFEDSFRFTETRDQLRSIHEAKEDMELPRPMDRLVCGDVGFGKTEVALRAAFKAVMDNKQVAILVPTTVLAQQHFNTFHERMAEFPVTVVMLSRFRSAAQQKEILQQASQGKIDIIIGTHRLLSKDVKFKDLGLLVIDEEHRFGVRHKERLKELKSEVDVLTMSATPIPRTLYMALLGARELSVIETAPRDRLPIETVVKAYDQELVQKAIKFELERGGQVFYLHNRVQSIHAVAARINEWLPDARVEVGHGQMTEHMLEKVMTRFVAGQTDVLVCTTIIENGLDIPNCNTIIIEGADRFGLSQLYQLRGRVGRFNRQAYAYLLLHRHLKLLDIARERLSAMRQHNQLGAGFKIAMRDLELRGAGNLLGSEQSGHVAAVGFELYCNLLRQSVARLKGDEVALRIRATVNLDFVSVGEGTYTRERDGVGFHALKEAELAAEEVPFIEAFIPKDYLAETRLRIDFYRRFAMVESEVEFDALREEMLDRFGKAPEPVEALLAVTKLRVLAEAAGVKSVETEGSRLKCLRATGKSGDFLKIGAAFPRLKSKQPLKRLREIEHFLLRHRPK